MGLSSGWNLGTNIACCSKRTSSLWTLSFSFRKSSWDDKIYIICSFTSLCVFTTLSSSTIPKPLGRPFGRVIDWGALLIVFWCSHYYCRCLSRLQTGFRALDQCLRWHWRCITCWKSLATNFFHSFSYSLPWIPSITRFKHGSIKIRSV